MKNAVVLLSGGLDSTTTLALAVKESKSTQAISFRYGQLHSVELEYAAYQAKNFKVVHKIIDIPTISGSHLTDGGGIKEANIPNTYVPARNTLFLSFALSVAEPIDADIWIGVNAIDYSGYPDCRPEFIQAFQTLANLGTRKGLMGNGPCVRTPLQNLNKVEIIKLARRLGVDYKNTISCYFPINGTPCMKCDSCGIRRAAFSEFDLL